MGTSVVRQVSPAIAAIYGAIALTFFVEAYLSWRKLKYMRKNNITKVTPIVYNYYLGSIIATITMGLRTVINVMMCDNMANIVFRIISNGMIIYAMFTASGLIWQKHIKDVYTLPCKGKDDEQ